MFNTIETQFENAILSNKTHPVKSLSNLDPLVRTLIEEYNVRFTNKSAREVIADIIDETGNEESFYVIDLGTIVKQYRQWVGLLPRVKPFYAMKCNPSKCILRIIAGLGGGFDCASTAEIALAMEMGATPDRIIFANPTKQVAQCKYANQVGVKMVTFDNEEELLKIKQHWPGAELVLRIITDDSKSVCQFSSKFGASIDHDAPRLIRRCRELDLNLIGISFHVGSGCCDPYTYEKSLRATRHLFDIAETEGFNMRLVDIGGGFSGSDNQGTVKFSEIAAVVAPVLDELFPPEVEVIAEPGRYFASAAYTIACNVFARRTVAPGVANDYQKEYLYYVNDGVYGSFNCIFFDHMNITLHPLAEDAHTREKVLSTVFGPTCDSLDCINKKVYLPEMEVGEWVYAKEMGAYTVAAASAFNGFKTHRFYYIMGEEFAPAVTFTVD